MSRENLETVRNMFDAVERRDLAGVLAAYDSEIVVREADSLPYGGTFHGIEGATKHATGAAQIWDDLQTPAERKLDAQFLDAGDYVVVLWRQKGKVANGGKFDMPVVSVYKMRDGKVVESQMFHADSFAVRAFLESAK
jgi:ketosteroid isomerase-like protein